MRGGEYNTPEGGKAVRPRGCFVLDEKPVQTALIEQRKKITLTAVISVGDNSYGHPTRTALLRLAAVDAEIYRTDVHGNILITVGQ